MSGIAQKLHNVRLVRLKKLKDLTHIQYLSNIVSLTADMATLSSQEAAAAESFKPHERLNLGCLIMSMMVDTLLLGMMIAQLKRYFMFSTDDRIMTRSIVITASVVAFAGSVFNMYLMGYFLADGFGTYRRFDEGSLTHWTAFFSIVPSVCVQTFFAYRSYALNAKSKPLLAVIGICIATSFVGALGIIPAANPHAHILLLMWLIGAVCADTLISSSIMRALLSSRDDFDPSDHTISNLVRLMVETQLPPTLIVIAFLLGNELAGDTFLHIFFQVVSPKFYTCGLLASLNSRHLIRKVNKDANDQMPLYKGMSYQLSHLPAVVHVLTETYVHNETQTRQHTNPSKDLAARDGLAKIPYSARDFAQPATLTREVVAEELDDDSYADDEEHARARG